MNNEKELKLLLLEDDPADAALIQATLLRSGMHFRSHLAGNEKEFLKALDEDQFDAVLADNGLPQYTSLKALEVIKKKDPFMAFILVTGTVSEEFAVNIILQGADDYILKTNLTRLPAAVKKAIENKLTEKTKYNSDQEMHQLNEQLRSLTAYLQKIREEEQTRIAREIHDELGQMLSLIKINISSADKKMQRSVMEARINLNEALQTVEKTIIAVRKIASDLRPGILDDLGLVATLEWKSQEFAAHSNIEVNFDSSISEIQVEKNIATGIYRIYQETLTNILRHSEADKVTVKFSIKQNQIVFSVLDNGKGFNPQEIKAKKTLGLLGLNERALLMKGQLMIESFPGTGTMITLLVPLTPVSS